MVVSYIALATLHHIFLQKWKWKCWQPVFAGGASNGRFMCLNPSRIFWGMRSIMFLFGKPCVKSHTFSKAKKLLLLDSNTAKADVVWKKKHLFNSSPLWANWSRSLACFSSVPVECVLYFVLSDHARLVSDYRASWWYTNPYHLQQSIVI